MPNTIPQRIPAPSSVRLPTLSGLSRWCALVVACFAQPVSAQVPAINAIVNAASYAAPDARGSGIVPGAIATLFGRNLAPSVAQAPGVPLPRQLAGTSVTVDGVPAALFFVSSDQINFQVPTSLYVASSDAAARTVPVVVTSAAGVSQPANVRITENSVGVFTQNGSGCGPGAIQNVLADGTRQMNTTNQSAAPGDFASVYATGLGWSVSSPPRDGEPALAEPLSRRLVGGGVSLGPEGFRVFVPDVTFRGRAPGLVGVDQLDFRIPDTSPEGCAVPLIVTGLFSFSQPVTMSIKRGGGQCQDDPPARFGSLRWVRKMRTGPEPGTSVAEESFAASIVEAPAGQVSPAPLLPERYGSCFVGDIPAPRCPGTGLKPLDIGSLNLDGVVGGPLTVVPDRTTGEVIYSRVLPEGTVKAGTLSVSATGGKEVGAFQTTILVPAALQFSGPLAPGTPLSWYQPFRVTWSGGRVGQTVRLRLLAMFGTESWTGCEHVAPATDGQITIGVGPRGDLMTLAVPPSDNVRAVITVEPTRGQVPFSAPGLTRDATHEWSYQYEFTGLKIVR